MRSPSIAFDRVWIALGTGASFSAPGAGTVPSAACCWAAGSSGGGAGGKIVYQPKTTSIDSTAARIRFLVSSLPIRRTPQSDLDVR